MKTITPAQKQTLEDLSAEGLLRGLPVQTAEKDIHITDLLRSLSELKVFHNHFGDLDARHGEKTRHDDGIQLVFAGGTCLSKAHGLIDRMSEDIDIKVVMTPAAKPLKKGRRDRVRLKALHDHIPALLCQMGLPLLQYPADANPHIRDSHRYFVIGAEYQSAYAELPSLRPELKLEIIQRAPLLPLEKRQFGYLHESLSGLAPSLTVTMDCVCVAETTAEKVLSLLRRCAYKWDGYQPHGDIDPTLVRHVYDVARIAEQLPGTLDAARSIFAQLVMNDRDEFKGQNPKFDADPVDVLRRTLVAARGSAQLRYQYTQTLLPLVYDSAPSTFESAIAGFESVAQELLAAH